MHMCICGGTKFAATLLFLFFSNFPVVASLVPRPSRFSSRIEIIAHNVRTWAGRSGYEASGSFIPVAIFSGTTYRGP